MIGVGNFIHRFSINQRLYAIPGIVAILLIAMVAFVIFQVQNILEVGRAQQRAGEIAYQCGHAAINLANMRKLTTDLRLAVPSPDKFEPTFDNWRTQYRNFSSAMDGLDAIATEGERNTLAYYRREGAAYARAMEENYASYQALPGAVVQIRFEGARDRVRLLFDRMDSACESFSHAAKELGESTAGQVRRIMASVIVISLLTLLSGVLLTLLIARTIQMPLRIITRTVEEVARGDGNLSERIGVKTRDEYGRLAFALNQFLDMASQFKDDSALSHRKFHAIFEGASDAILLLDGEKFIECNTRAEEIFCRRRSEIVGHSPAAVSPEFQEGGITSQARAQEKMSIALAGQPQRFEWVHVRPDGERFVAEVSMKRLDFGAEPVLLAIVRDMSAWKAVEAELRRKNEELERFAYTASHDLKNPLVTIQSFAGLVREQIRDNSYEGVIPDLELIEAAGAKMNLLLDGILSLFSVSRRLQARSHCDLDSIVRDVLLDVSFKLPTNVEIRHSLFRSTVFCDRSLIAEAFRNILLNAGKFSRGHIHPFIELGMLDTLVYIRDNGDGFEPGYSERIFGLFEKLDPASEGAGMGLVIARRIMELHGGRIWGESPGPGQGATFYLDFGEALRKTL